MSKTAATVVMKESRRFELDFGYIDCVCSVLFCIAIWLRSRERARKGKAHAWVVNNSCHWFGAFAFFADYILYYHMQGTRTVEYPNGDTPMTPFGNFLFFFWFDWINGAVIVMWAMLVCEDLLVYNSGAQKAGKDGAKQGAVWNEATDRCPIWMLVVVPLWFWSTPPLSRFNLLPIDNRLLLVTRPSEKDKYWMLMVLFIAVMKVWHGMHFRQILRVLVSGVGCGMIHHAPLFFFGMRGYSSPKALVVTLLTEWPAIMMGLFVITKFLVGSSAPAAGAGASHEQKRGGKRAGFAFLAIVFAAGFAGQKTSVRSIVYELMPYVQARPYQKLGQTFLRAKCMLPSMTTPALCDVSSTRDLWVAAAAQKGSAVMTAMISLDIADTCGRCVGIGDRPNGDWPNPVETPPPYDSEVLLAIANMPTWPGYVAQQGAPLNNANGRKARCIVLLRDPVARLVSTFLYAKASREPWFREHGIDKAINDLIAKDSSGRDGEDLESAQAAVAYMLERFGLAYILETHSYLAANLAHGCSPIKYEDLKSDFNGTMSTWFDAWGISKAENVRSALLSAVAPHNPSIQTSDNHHATGALFSRRFKSSVEAAFLSNVTLARIIDAQRKELKYATAAQVSFLSNAL